MERGHQHFGVTLVSAGDIVSAAAFERAQAAGHYSGRRGVRGHDADCGRAGGAAARSAVSAGDLGDESLRYGALDRADDARASSPLSRAGGPGILAAAASGRDSGIERALQPDVGAGAEDDYPLDSDHHVSAAGAKGAGEGGTKS